ncbi:MAG: hypothetical protein M3340_01390 [Actinomycetota bacterium]|nr:hypothetical protein [Actinomycetota bacterium]
MESGAIQHARVPRNDRRRRWILGVGNFFLWFVTPVAWLLGVGLVGPELNHALSLPLTAALFVLMFIGLPLTMIVIARLLFRLDARLSGEPVPAPRVRVRVPAIRTLRPPEAEPIRLEHPPLSGRERVAGALVIGLMIAGSVVLWAGVPLFWIWFASQLTDTTQPSLEPYLLIIVAIPITMVLGSRILFRLQLLYCRIAHLPQPTVGRAAWLKSLSDRRGSMRPIQAIDGVMALSVATAILLLVFWFAFFADLSGLLPPELQNMSR